MVRSVSIDRKNNAYFEIYTKSLKWLDPCQLIGKTMASLKFTQKSEMVRTMSSIRKAMLTLKFTGKCEMVRSN